MNREIPIKYAIVIIIVAQILINLIITEQEMKDISEGRPIFLETYGGMPPVSLFTEDENGKPSFIDEDSIGSDIKAKILKDEK